MRAERAFAALAAAALIAAAPAGPDRPVMVGGEAEYDACASTFQVTGLKADGDNFLSLRASPSTSAREIARLRPGQVVWGCDHSADGKWTGVLVAPEPGVVDCGVGTPIAKRQPYRGPCRAGWVSTRYLTILAG